MSAPPPVELFEGGRRPARWRARWTALPRSRRILGVGLVVLLLLGAGGAWLRDRSAEQDRRERLQLSASLGVWASSTTRPEGEINYFLLVRNDGALPMSLTAADGAGGGLRVRMRDGAARRIAPGEEAVFPLSIRLTCGGAPTAGDGLPTDLTVRRQDGGSVVRRVDLEPAGALFAVAEKVCAVRPALRDLELSGPVLRVGE